MESMEKDYRRERERERSFCIYFLHYMFLSNKQKKMYKYGTNGSVCSHVKYLQYCNVLNMEITHIIVRSLGVLSQFQCLSTDFVFIIIKYLLHTIALMASYRYL